MSEDFFTDQIENLNKPHFLICKECFDKLQSYGDLCFQICMKACQAYSCDRFLSFFPKNTLHLCQVLRFLESKGILISTEIGDEEIGFIPIYKGIYIDDDTKGFCWCTFEEELKALFNERD